MIHSFQLETHRLNNIVLQQGKKAKHVYIVISGDYEIVKKVKMQWVSKDMGQTKKLIGPFQPGDSKYQSATV